MKIRNEVKIGAVAIVAFVLLYLGLNFLKGINLFEPENRYHVRLTNLNGTAVATPVMISGYKVGSVQQVDFAYDAKQGYGAKLVLGLDPDVQIPAGSTIKVKTNVLSGAELVISAPKEFSRSFLKSGDTIPVAGSDDIVSTVNEKIMPDVVKMMPEIIEMVKRLNEIAANPAIDSMLRNLNHTTLEMNKAMAQINTSLKPMPEMMHNMNTLSKSLVKVGHTAEQLPLDSLVANLNATTRNFKQLSDELKSNKGTMGKLMNDPSLYNRLDSLAMSAEALMKDLKANPKRYVHFSIFGRKQEAPQPPKEQTP